MTVTLPTYVEVIGNKFPSCGVRVVGTGNNYADLIYVNGSPIPTEQELIDAQLTMIKELKCTEINDYRNTLIFTKFLYDNIEWDCNEAAFGNINEAYDAVKENNNELPPELPTWRDFNNIDRSLPNGAYVIALKQEMTRHRAICHMAGRWHKGMVMAMTTVQEVIAYQYVGGWPNVTPV